MKLRSLLLLIAVSSSLVVGCSGADDSMADDQDVTVGESNGAKVTPGEFELGDQPHSIPSACDVHTHLSLKNDGSSTATLSEVVGGMCRLAVQPNLRTYRLRLSPKIDCGTKIYTGSIKRDGTSSSIKITDHRARTCEDVIPAAIIVEETVAGYPGPITTTLYARDAAPGAGAAVTLTGTLVHTVGIGGENTGSSIQTNDQGTLELVLDGGEAAEFAPGKTARVKGTLTFLNGVETHNRKAVDVTEILLCPATDHIDCMPGPNVRLSSYCAGENRAWVGTSCPGVTFTD
jgi:hypothetical protein